MDIFAKKLLTKRKQKAEEEQHITNVLSARMEDLSFDDSYKEICCSSISGNTSLSYVYIYLDDTINYRPYCVDDDGNILIITRKEDGSPYGITISPTNYDAGLHIFHGGIENVVSGKIVQTFVIKYTKVE